MAISATYLQLQQQIAMELGDRTQLLAGSGIWSPIKNAIQSAIAKFERERFYFNEMYNSSTPLFTTVAGQELYTTAAAAGIVTAPEIDELRALVSGTYRVLTKRSWAYLSDISSNPSSRGQPDEWAYLASNIRLYPIPDGAYQVRPTQF
jgi:hypothetical protein